MTDLTYCYLHMNQYDLLVLDTVDTPDYMDGALSDEELDIPAHLVPPNPDDSDILPSQVHPSYPYGNPLHTKHPSARPRPPFDPGSRALFEDMGYAGGGVNGSLRWKDLGLDDLLPVDEEKEEAKRAMHARKMASGSSNNNPQQQGQQHQAPPPPQQEEEDDDEEDEEEDEDEDDLEGDENIGESFYDEDEDEEELEEEDEDEGDD